MMDISRDKNVIQLNEICHMLGVGVTIELLVTPQPTPAHSGGDEKSALNLKRRAHVSS